jgi:small subunit ribosomal protein S8
MLTRLRNSILVKSRKVDVVRTNLTVSIAEILKKEGFIESFEESGDVFLTQNGFVHKYISITLKYKGIKQIPYITQLKRISKPGLRVYTCYKKIPRVLGGVGVAVCAICSCVLFKKIIDLDIYYSLY